MAIDDRLQELLLRWEESKEAGLPAAPEELCPDNPELLEKLRQRIEKLKAMDDALNLPKEAESEWPTFFADRDCAEAATIADGREHPARWGGKSAWPSLPGYEILGELGQGGMGLVFKARQLGLNRLVAVKMILDGSFAGAAMLERFRMEAEAVARLQHQNLVQIFEIGEFERHPYFSMELVDGGNLADKINGRPQPFRESAELVETLARVMLAVHKHGIIHRDLKPANVLLTTDGVPKVTDFGLVKRLDDQTSPTGTDQALGTPSYMAPEQADARIKEIGPATDVYALGAILYEMLTGRPPFTGDTPLEIVLQVIQNPPISPKRLQPSVPVDLETICLKCLEKNAAKRYASALDLAEDLGRFLRKEPIHARPVGRLERLGKWAARHPALAGLWAVSILAAITFAASGVTYTINVRRLLGELQSADAENQRQLIRLDVAQGTRELNDGNWFVALAWFTEALRREEAGIDTALGEVHRMRIGMILRQSPKLSQLWLHREAVNHVEFSPDGRFVVTASDDDTACVWDTKTGAPAGAPLKHGDDVLYASFSPDARRLVTASRDGTARCWEVQTSRPIGVAMKHRGPVTVACFSNDGAKILTASSDGSARLWHGDTGQPATEPMMHQGAVAFASFSGDSSMVVTASADGTARVWNAETGHEVCKPLKHGAAVTYAVFHPEGKRVLTACDDGKARLWNISAMQELPKEFKHRGAVVQAVFSKDGEKVLTASKDQTACLWSTKTQEILTPPLTHFGELTAAALSNDGRWVGTCSEDNTTRLWDARTGRAVLPLLQSNGTACGAQFSLDRRFLVSAARDGVTRLWDLAKVTLPPDETASIPAERGKRSRSQVWSSPDGRLKLVAESGFSAKIIDIATGQTIGEPITHASRIRAAAFSPDDRYLATGSDDNTARIWSTQTGELRLQPMTHDSNVYFVTFDHSGQLLGTVSGNGAARVWDALSGEPITPPLDFSGQFVGASFAKDDSEFKVTIASAEGEKATTWPLQADDRRIAELQNIAQVLAGSKIDPAQGLLPLGHGALEKAWKSWVLASP
jgi:WD40 repeat protein